MCYQDFGIAETLMKLKQRDAQRQAERSYLISIAGIARSQQSPKQGFHLVHQMGRSLSALGQRLEQVGLPQTSPH